jgi:hypothetical protein
MAAAASAGRTALFKKRQQQQQQLAKKAGEGSNGSTNGSCSATDRTSDSSQLFKLDDAADAVTGTSSGSGQQCESPPI